MTRADIEIVEVLAGRERVVRFSEGYIVGTQVIVLSGPLQGMDVSMKRIDRL